MPTHAAAAVEEPLTHHGADGQAIVVNQLSKRFRVDDGVVTALDKVSLDVRQGEFVAIVGPSGCGKSTLLKILTGLLAPERRRNAHWRHRHDRAAPRHRHGVSGAAAVCVAHCA